MTMIKTKFLKPAFVLCFIPALIVAIANSGCASSATNAATPPVVQSPPETNDLQFVNFAQVKQLLHDPGYANGSIIFVDARDDD